MMEAIARVIPYAALISVVVGVLFGVVSAISSRRQRTLMVAASLIESVQTMEFTRAMQRVLDLPVSAPPERVLDDEELVRAAYVIGHVFESLGVMVFRRLMPLHLVDELIGGYARASWSRLEPYVRARRATLGPSFAEWFQWLAEAMIRDPAPGKEHGAAEAHRGWKRKPSW